MTYVVAKAEWHIDVSGRRYVSGFDRRPVVGVGKSVDLAVSDAATGGRRAAFRCGKKRVAVASGSASCSTTAGNHVGSDWPRRIPQRSMQRNRAERHDQDSQASRG